MSLQRWKSVLLWTLPGIGLCCLLSGHAAHAEDPAAPAKPVEVVPVPNEAVGVSTVEAARDRARTMSKLYTSTLDVLHHHYFRVNKAVLPARAMEDIFSDVEDTSGAKAGWIAVNVRAMSVDHEPSTEFEKAAAKVIATGTAEVEHVEGGLYQYASAIPLQESCVNCHMGVFSNPPKKLRYAGLVISIPIQTKE